jgi:UDP-glucose 4-epimerase
MLDGKVIAVTGSSGFVGSHLVNRIKESNAIVLGLDIKDGIDITNWKQIRAIDKIDILVHLAARTFVPDACKEPRELYHANIIGTINALELGKIHNAKIIFASSYVYGIPQWLPLDEEHPVFGFNPYALSKIICEQLCRAYHDDFGVKVVILRPFNIYGMGQDERFLIPSIVKQARTGRIVLNDPMPKRDFIYIEDMVNAYLKAIEYESSNLEVFNIGSGVSYSVRDIADIVCSVFSSNVEVEFRGKTRKNEIPDTVADISKAMELLEWEPKVSIEEGLRDIIRKTLM